ncbi:MAG: DUF1385 domain-containing protein [candidate division WOR-3 bacterium]|nr:DUF1385 domain-containing protein [candidate division WOR-3 bacterium]
MNKNIRAGGQAIIEGVMMLVNGGWAIAVRKESGDIEVRSKPYTRWAQRNKIISLPFIRGIVSFLEMLNLGMDSLNLSADIYYDEENKKKGFKDLLMTIVSFIAAIGIAVGLFLFIPIKLGNWLNLQSNQIYFNLFLGVLRMVFFILYILVISLWKDIKRIFMYHGAEHKAVYAFENGVDLNIENVRKYSTKHPRCGTSFIFIVLIIAIIFYSVIDTIVFNQLNITNNALNRLINHLIFLPVIAAIAFEILTLAGKYFKNKIVKILLLPGLLFQFITTKEPTNEMLEVSIASLKAALKAAGLEELSEDRETERED